MADTEPHHAAGGEHVAGHIDWKAVIAGLALTWTVLLGAAGLFRAHLLDAIDVRIAEHQAAAAESRRAFFRELEQRSEGAVGRIGEIEINCARFQDWRQHVDRDLAGLLTWRDAADQRLAQGQAWIALDDRRMDALERNVEALKELTRGRRTASPQEDRQ